MFIRNNHHLLEKSEKYQYIFFIVLDIFTFSFLAFYFIL